jgi:hypothetical protein
METISVGSNQFIEHAPPSEASAAMTPSLTWIEQNLSRERPLPVIALQSRFPVSRSTTRVRHGHDQDATSFDSINDAEWEALKQVPAGSMVERRLCFRRRTMADSAASISPLNAAGSRPPSPRDKAADSPAPEPVACASTVAEQQSRLAHQSRRSERCSCRCQCRSWKSAWMKSSSPLIIAPSW